MSLESTPPIYQQADESAQWTVHDTVEAKIASEQADTTPTPPVLTHEQQNFISASYQEYATDLYTYARSILARNPATRGAAPELAEEAVQEAFISILRGMNTHDYLARLQENPRPFLYRTVHNKCIDSTRRKDYTHTEALEYTDDIGTELSRANIADASQNTEDQVIERMSAADILAGVNSLPERHAKIILLACCEELTMAQAAEYLNVTENAVKMRLYRARIYASKHLAPLYMPEGSTS